MFRSGLLLITSRRHYSVYTATGICHALMLTSTLCQRLRAAGAAQSVGLFVRSLEGMNQAERRSHETARGRTSQLLPQVEGTMKYG